MFSRVISRYAGRSALSSTSNGSYQRLAALLLASRVAPQTLCLQVQSIGARRSYADDATAKTIAQDTTTATTTGRPRGRPRKDGSKPAAKKTSKKTGKKPGSKKSARPKKRKAKATLKKNPKTKKRASKKPVTPEVAQKTRVSELRKVALLKGPKMLPGTAYLAFCVENFATSTGSLPDKVKSIVEKYKGLSASQREHYENIARANKTANDKTKAEWVESHTPDEIRLANNARRQLNKLSKQSQLEGTEGTTHPLVRARAGRFQSIKDSRKIKSPGSPFIMFSNERWASGDFKGLTLGEAGKRLGAEWKSIGEAEKQRLEEKFKENSEKYMQDTPERKRPAIKSSA